MKLLVYSISFLFPKSLISVIKILLFSILQVHQLLIMYCVINHHFFLSITFPSLRNLPRIFYYYCYQIVIINYGVWLPHSYSLSLFFFRLCFFFLFSFPSRLGWRIFNTSWKLSTRCKQRRQREQRTRKRKLSKKKRKFPPQWYKITLRNTAIPLCLTSTIKEKKRKVLAFVCHFFFVNYVESPLWVNDCVYIVSLFVILWGGSKFEH